jgi:hypothetical protein
MEKLASIQSKVTEKIISVLGLQPAVDVIPQNLSRTIQPIIDVNPSPRIDLVKSQSKSTTGSVVVYTTPSDKDFYLTNAALNCQADAACDNTEYVLECYTETGEKVNVIRFNKLTTTAYSNSQALTLKHPIKIKRGTEIKAVSVFSAGNSNLGVVIQGYIDYNAR